MNDEFPEGELPKATKGRFRLVFGTYLAAAFLTMVLLSIKGGVWVIPHRLDSIESFLLWLWFNVCAIFVFFPMGFGYERLEKVTFFLPHLTYLIFIIYLTNTSYLDRFRFFYICFVLLLISNVGGCVATIQNHHEAIMH